MAEVAFYGFSTLAIGAALTILFTRNVMYAALCLFLALLGVAALYVLAGADFLAITQLLIYVGGVLVLLIFGIMLTYRPDREGNQKKNYVITTHVNQFWGGLVALGIFGVLFWIIVNANFMILHSPQLAEFTSQRSTLRTIGVSLMTTHVWAFEVAGILLLVALVGAAYVATQREK
ncbi:NADH-quinone oxidoreductase subunit J family protein [Runella sp.]|uniref:NADH-quinone oxidoreductase subunit J family protein n=1 Tax=Runella sp. TaxID=1960881 RepID=UPI003D0A11A7